MKKLARQKRMKARRKRQDQEIDDWMDRDRDLSPAELTERNVGPWVHYEGAVVIHGMVENPEATFPPDLMQAFELYGTIMSVCDGYRMVIQRFGGGEGDSARRRVNGFEAG